MVCYYELACQIIYQISCSLIILSTYFINNSSGITLLFLSFHFTNSCHRFFKNMWQFVMTAKASVFTAAMSQPDNLLVCSGIFWWNYCSVYGILSYSPEWIPWSHSSVVSSIQDVISVSYCLSCQTLQQHNLWNYMSKWKLLLQNFVINMCAVYHGVDFF